MESFNKVQKEALRHLTVASKEDLKKVAADIGIQSMGVTKAEGKGELGPQ